MKIVSMQYGVVTIGIILHIDNNYEKISCLVAPNDEIRSQLVDNLFMEITEMK